MDYYNKILILQKYYKQQNDIENANKILLQIKSLHGKVIEHILMLKESKEDNKLELLSDLERINYKIILIIDECEDIIDDNFDKKEDEKEIVKPKKDNKLNKNIPSLILFYAEWCGHCKNLMPIWDALSDLLPSDKINMVKISCVEKEKECNSIKDIKGYPTIIFVDIELNKKIVYSGERTPESIINFINKCVGNQIIKITK